MATRYRQDRYYVNARKRLTPRVRDKYNPTASEENLLMNDVSDNSAAHEYGYSPRWIDAAIDRHMKGNARMRRVIEEQLTDVNYHKLSRQLQEGDYKGALRDNKQYYKEYGVKPTNQYRSMYAAVAG